MKVVLYEVRFEANDTKSGEHGHCIEQVVAPDMPLEEAIKYMKIWAIHNWPYNFIEVEVVHIQKNYTLGWT
jgi:hypothetical protein